MDGPPGGTPISWPSDRVWQQRTVAERTAMATVPVGASAADDLQVAAVNRAPPFLWCRWWYVALWLLWTVIFVGLQLTQPRQQSSDDVITQCIMQQCVTNSTSPIAKDVDAIIPCFLDCTTKAHPLSPDTSYNVTLIQLILLTVLGAAVGTVPDRYQMRPVEVLLFLVGSSLMSVYAFSSPYREVYPVSPTFVVSALAPAVFKETYTIFCKRKGA